MNPFNLFKRKKTTSFAHQPTRQNRPIAQYDRRFASNAHGLQMFNGPNPTKVLKAGALFGTTIIASTIASCIMFDEFIPYFAAALLISALTCALLSLHCKKLGEKRRVGSNLLTRGVIAFERFQGNMTQTQAELISTQNDTYNLLNGAAVIFDDLAPGCIKSLFEDAGREISRIDAPIR